MKKKNKKSIKKQSTKLVNKNNDFENFKKLINDEEFNLIQNTQLISQEECDELFSEVKIAYHSKTVIDVIKINKLKKFYFETFIKSFEIYFPMDFDTFKWFLYIAKQADVINYQIRDLTKYEQIDSLAKYNAICDYESLVGLT